MRYEAHLTRQADLALRELQRLQALRRGHPASAPPPAVVEGLAPAAWTAPALPGNTAEAEARPTPPLASFGNAELTPPAGVDARTFRRIAALLDGHWNERLPGPDSASFGRDGRSAGSVSHSNGGGRPGPDRNGHGP